MNKILYLIAAISMITLPFGVLDQNADSSNVLQTEPCRGLNEWDSSHSISEAVTASFLGQNNETKSGYSTSIVGDLDGDGYDDIAISAIESNISSGHSGQVYIYFGRKTGWQYNMSLLDADASFHGERTGDRIGTSVSGAGDVNRDGFEDLLIGTHAYPGGNNKGKTYLFFGKPKDQWNMGVNISSSDASFIGQSQGDMAGEVSGVGDVNDDGFSDFMIGASRHGSGKGISYLFFGKDSGWSNEMGVTTANASYVGESEGDMSGYRICGVGNVNRDDYDDILISAPGRNENQGKTYLVLGMETGWSKNNPLSVANASFIGEVKGDRSGMAISGWGDANGDGIDDILIGAGYNDEGGKDSGQSYLIFGRLYGWKKDMLLSDSDASFIGSPGSLSGWALSISGDINSDTLDDLVISGPDYIIGTEKIGIVYMVYGRESNWSMDMDLVNSNAVFIGENVSDSFGYSLSTSGDVNGDGNEDILIGAPLNDKGGLDSGQTYLVLGKGFSWRMNTPLSLADSSFVGENPRDFFGYECAVVGDVNGDGFNDWVVCAYLNDESYEDAGQVYLFLGRENNWGHDFNISNADASFLGENHGDNIGPMCGSGDVNNDGFDDFLISSPWNDQSGTNAGKVYLILGKKNGWEMDTPLSEADASFLGENAEDEAGIGTSIQGDVNGDGFDDILIGAPYNDESINDAGKTYLLFGKDGGWVNNISLSQADASYLGVNSGASSGMTPCIQGDINGDGFDDILIPNRPGLDSRIGEVYLIFGKSFGFMKNKSLLLSDASFIEEFQADRFGGMEGPAGDINGDGLDDILITAGTATSNGKATGKAYLYFGRSSGWKMKINVSEADVTFIGENDGDYIVVATGDGDLNDDGYDDIIIGAPYNSNAGYLYGNTYVIFGQPSGYPRNYSLSEADASFVGLRYYNLAGMSCYILGDVNNDGFDDFFTTSIFNNNGGLYEGKGYLIYGRKFLGARPQITLNKTYISSQLDGNRSIKGELEIKWEAWDEESADDLSISIFYRRGETGWKLIANNLENTGSYIWNTNKPRVKDGSKYYIMVKAEDENEQISSSELDFSFRIDNPDPPSIRILSPGLGEIITGQSTVEWRAEDDEDQGIDLKVDLFFSEDSGENYTLLASDLKYSDSFTYDTSDYPDGYYYRFKLTVRDTSGLETSIETMNIQFLNDPKIEILLPMEGDVISEIYKIRWIASDPGDFDPDLLVSIWLSWDMGQSYDLVMKDRLNTGEYEIDTTEYPDSKECMLKMEVSDPSGKNHTAVSDVFTILNTDPPKVVFTGPPTGEVYSKTIKLTWNATDDEDGPGALLYSLYYQFHGDEMWYQLEHLQPNNGFLDLDTLSLVTGDGKYTLMIRVQDTYLEVSEPSYLEIEVYNPDYPEIKYPFGPYFPIRDGIADFEWYATDPDPGEEDQLLVWYYVSIDGEEWTTMVDGILNENQLSMDVSGLQDDEYFVKMKVSDDQPGENERSVEVVLDQKMVLNNQNDPPEVEVIEGPSSDVEYSNDITFTWTGSDPDGDDISYTLFYRLKDSSNWIPIPGAQDIKETTYTWNVSKLDEGFYQVKIVGKEDYIEELESEWISEEFYVKPVKLDIGNEDREVTVNYGLLIGIAAGFTVLVMVIVWILFLNARKRETSEIVHPDDLDPSNQEGSKEAVPDEINEGDLDEVFTPPPDPLTTLEGTPQDSEGGNLEE